jgi:16S rRNA processing protein RimM
VESVRVQEKNNRLSFFVKFEHVTDRTQAEELKNFAVFANRDTVESLMQLDDVRADYTAFEIWAKDKKIGSVEAVMQTPAHPILQVITDKQEPLLVPLVEEYVTGIDKRAKKIQCKNLEQLKGL